MLKWNSAPVVNIWFIYQGATNRVHNVQKYTNKFVVYAKFLEAVQSFERQYNRLSLSFVWFDPAFFIGWKLFCLFVYLDLSTGEYLINCSTVFIILIKFSLSTVYQDSRPLALVYSAHEGNSKFEVLLVKIFSPK